MCCIFIFALTPTVNRQNNLFYDDEAQTQNLNLMQILLKGIFFKSLKDYFQLSAKNSN